MVNVSIKLKRLPECSGVSSVSSNGVYTSWNQIYNILKPLVSIFFAILFQAKRSLRQ
jgi:hypothetical protein